MKKAVIYGAGNIGRGFIGQLFFESGYQTTFIDINQELVRELNKQGGYPVRIVSASGEKELEISNVRAVDGLDRDKVAQAISGAQIMATAVGVAVLPHIAANIAAGLQLRWQDKKVPPLNIIVCENMIGANSHLAGLVREKLEPGQREAFRQQAGFIAASVGRMVPVMTEKMQAGNILRVFVEPYCELPVDRAGFVGQIPAIGNLLPVSPFAFYEQRKLYVHNLGHALLAYLGFVSGHEYIWQAVRDRVLYRVCRAGMLASARALALEHKQDLADLALHVDDLLLRFDNPGLADTVHRVGRDVRRKLAAADRLAGALDLCLRQGVDPAAILLGMQAALSFARQNENVFPVAGPDRQLWRDLQELSQLTWEKDAKKQA